LAKRIKATTIRDVAEAAGVSQSTVSLVLNSSAAKYRISKTTQAKVTAAAEKLRYVPLKHQNRALSFTGGQIEDPIVCVFWEAYFDHGPLKEFFQGLTRYKNECNDNFEFAVHSYTSGNLANMSRIINSGIYHGFIFTGLSDEDEAFIASIDTDAPIVIFNRDLGNLSAVLVDNYKVGQRAASALLKNCAASLVCVNPQNMHKNPGIRHAGVYDTCIKEGVPHDSILNLYTENSYNGGYSAAEKVLNSVTPPFSVFVSGDTMLTGFVKCLREHGCSIPGDAYIVAYGNSIVSEILSPSITSISPPTSDMGYDCVQMIDMLMKGAGGKGNVKKHECILTYRESCPEVL